MQGQGADGVRDEGVWGPGPAISVLVLILSKLSEWPMRSRALHTVRLGPEQSPPNAIYFHQQYSALSHMP